MTPAALRTLMEASPYQAAASRRAETGRQARLSRRSRRGRREARGRQAARDRRLSPRLARRQGRHRHRRRRRRHRHGRRRTGGLALASARPMFASDRVAAELLEIAKDKAINAVVFRVDSGGGSATASDQIWNAVKTVQASGKKVVVSMGSMAASGGYYVAAERRQRSSPTARPSPAPSASSAASSPSPMACASSASTRTRSASAASSPAAYSDREVHARPARQAARSRCRRPMTASPASSPRAASCRCRRCRRSRAAASGLARTRLSNGLVNKTGDLIAAHRGGAHPRRLQAGRWRRAAHAHPPDNAVRTDHQHDDAGEAPAAPEAQLAAGARRDRWQRSARRRCLASCASSASLLARSSGAAGDGALGQAVDPLDRRPRASKARVLRNIQHQRLVAREAAETARAGCGRRRRATRQSAAAHATCCILQPAAQPARQSFIAVRRPAPRRTSSSAARPASKSARCMGECRPAACRPTRQG